MNKQRIFQSGSTTYFNSSRFFPADIRREVAILYSFLRLADNYIDKAKPDIPGFNRFYKLYQLSQTSHTKHPIIDDFAQLAQKKSFESTWVEAFFDSMKQDLHTKTYPDLNHTIKYMYGSAEVVGLMMARIMQLDPKADTFAKLLGRAMQYANFIRDIHEDYLLGRNYFPQPELKKFHLPDLSPHQAHKNPQAFTDFIQAQINHYRTWQTQAEEGYKYIPKAYLIPIKTAAQMYQWTMDSIEKKPLLVYKTKLKPSKTRILLTAIYNRFTL